jgi:hypothetical protein
MYNTVSFDGVPEAELKRPKLKGDDDLLEAASAQEGPGDPQSHSGEASGDDDDGGGVSRRGLYLAALGVFAVALFAVPPEWHGMQQRQAGTTEAGTEARTGTTMIDYARIRAETAVHKPFSHVVGL